MNIKPLIVTIKPLIVTGSAVFSSVAAMNQLTSSEGEWLLIGLGVLGFLALLFNNTLGVVQKMKALKNGSITPTPLPVVIEKSLAEKFVDVPKFERFEKYVHDSHHEIRDAVQAVKLEGEERGDKTEQFLRELNGLNEKRVEKIHDRINTVAEEMPGKVLSLLKTTGHLRWPNEDKR